MPIKSYYVEKTLSEVLAYFVKGFQPPQGQYVVKSESVVDPVQDKVILKIWLDNTPSLFPRDPNDEKTMPNPPDFLSGGGLDLSKQ